MNKILGGYIGETISSEIYFTIKDKISWNIVTDEVLSNFDNGLEDEIGDKVNNCFHNQR